MQATSNLSPLVPAALAALVALGGGAAPARAEDEATIRSEYAALSREMNELARGVEYGLGRDDVTFASRLYLLETKSIRLIQDAAESAYPDDATREIIGANLRALHGDVLRLQERVLDHALVELDRALPGEPARDVWAREGVDLYRPLFRLGTPVPGAPPLTRGEGRSVLARMTGDFLGAGGSLDQIRWLGLSFLESVESGELVEWVQLGERFRLTTAGAKHPVIAGGASVRGAGSMRLYKDSRGEVILAVVSSSSGNYKPGVASVFGLTAKLEELGVPRDKILDTEILPGEPVLVKLLLKAKKTYSKEDIGGKIAALEQRATPPRQVRRPPRTLARLAPDGLLLPRIAGGITDLFTGPREMIGPRAAGPFGRFVDGMTQAVAGDRAARAFDARVARPAVLRAPRAVRLAR